MERRLAAIFAADMVGYSRLMEADEMGTIARQKRHREELIDPRIAQHGGKIIKLTGDGMIGEFPSVVEAVQCAVGIQREMEAREANIEDAIRIRYRIAVNLGDVVFDDEEGDVYGDGVNIAARLESLATPGGIVISGTAYDHLKANIDVGYVDLGEQKVKNISTPVRVYQVVSDGDPKADRARTKSRTPIFLTAAAVLMALGLAIWQFAPELGASSNSMSDGDKVLAMPQGPKIVVLPFENLSGDPDQDYFVDGLTDDLTTRLTQHGYLFVIARNSAFKYKGKSPDVRDVGRELGVDYVVEGSIRQSGDAIRINAKLLDATDSKQLWSKQYDRDLSAQGIFEIQDDLTSGISETIGGLYGKIVREVLSGTTAKPPTSISGYEAVLLAYHYWTTFQPENHARARAALEDVLEREPGYALGWAMLSAMYRAENDYKHNPLPNPLERALRAVEKSIELDPNLSTAYVQHARLTYRLRQQKASLISLESALVLAPNLPLNLHECALELTSHGEWDRALAVWQKAMKFDPTPPPWTYWTPLRVYYQRGEFERAYEYALRLKQASPNYIWVPALEAALLSELGRKKGAQEALSRTLALNPRFSEMAGNWLDVWFWYVPEFADRIMDALYRIGLEKATLETQ